MVYEKTKKRLKDKKFKIINGFSEVVDAILKTKSSALFPGPTVLPPSRGKWIILSASKDTRVPGGGTAFIVRPTSTVYDR